MSNAHPMDGFVWLGRLPIDDARRNMPLWLIAGAQYMDANERGQWHDIAQLAFASLTYNSLDEATRARFGIRVPS